VRLIKLAYLLIIVCGLVGLLTTLFHTLTYQRI